MIESSQPLSELQEKLRGFSAMIETGCIWKVSAALLPEPDLPYHCCSHQHPFCTAAKLQPGGEYSCVHHGSREIARQVEREPVPLICHCHAGASEVVVPILLQEECAGVIMAGPFRTAESLPTENLTEEFQKLPLLTEAKASGIMDFIPVIFGDVIRKIYLEFAGLLPRRPRDERILTILEYLRHHFRQNPSAAETAGAVFMSCSRMLHLFKAECGISFGAYLLKLRLREARRYLLASQWPIDQVAAQCGFADQSHFTAMFRREFSLPPLQYRKQFGHGKPSV